jgi:hypothetical protein
MRTTVSLDTDVYEAAMHISQSSGKRLGVVLSDLARRGLNQNNVPVKQRKARFPVFSVPADAPIIPASRVQRVINEEDLF